MRYRDVGVVVIWLVGVALIGAAVHDHVSVSGSYGVGATQVNDSEYRSSEVVSLEEVPGHHRDAVRDAIVDGHGTAGEGSASDLRYVVRYEGEVYRIYASSVSDPAPTHFDDWGPQAFVLALVWTALVWFSYRRLLDR